MQAPTSMSHVGTLSPGCRSEAQVLIRIWQQLVWSWTLQMWLLQLPWGDPQGDTSAETPPDHGVTEVLNLAEMAEFWCPEEPWVLMDHRSL